MPSEPKVSLEDLDRAPSSLPGADGALPPAEVAELSDSFTRVSDEAFKLREENSRLRQKLSTATILDGLITPYATKAFSFMCIYCGFVALVLIASGFAIGGFKLPESVLGFLVGSTAITVIGLVGMVLTGIFVGARRH